MSVATNRRYFRLDGGGETLLLMSEASQVPRIVYWGRTLSHTLSFEHLAAAYDTAPPNAALNHPVSLSLLNGESAGFFGAPALRGHSEGRAWDSCFALAESQCDGNAAEFRLIDSVAGLAVKISLTMDEATGVVRQSTTLTNTGGTSYTLDWLASSVLPVDERYDQLVSFYGSWVKEFQRQKAAFPRGQFVRENRRGRTSHDSFPALICCENTTTEVSGSCFAVHLGWSGNHRIIAEHDGDGQRQVQLGELLLPGEVVLKAGESYATPDAFCWRSDHGFNGLSQVFHTFLRENILPEPVGAGGLRRSRPVQFNSWEAVYFTHSAETLQELAEAAAAVGAERFVLDDGWFPGRNDDTGGLGDWWPDQEKYPNGLKPLQEIVTGLGMEFGLWIEPEMVNANSVLYKTHPDWILHSHGRQRREGRNQLVLDMSRQEVRDYLFDKLHPILRDVQIGYIKWDMNRDITEAGSGDRASVHRQTLGFYALLDRLRAAHPHVEFESCASGGGRIDAEVLSRTHRFWTSDSNDAFERQSIQYGCSLFFPPEITGSHVGPDVCHTTGRRHSMLYRAHTALFAHMGMEFDLRQLAEDDVVVLKKVITVYKQHRELLHTGNFHRLPFGFDCQQHPSARMGWGVVDAAQNEGLFVVFQRKAPARSDSMVVRFAGLDAENVYSVRLVDPVDPSVAAGVPQNHPLRGEGLLLSGRVLNEHGISLFMRFPETSALFHVVDSSAKAKQRVTEGAKS